MPSPKQVVRIVRMAFRPEAVAEFERIFSESKTLIRARPGCLRLELHRDAHHDNVFYTLSEWDSLESLDAYRRSELFGRVWPATKALFATAPHAWSLHREQVLE